MAEGWDSLTLNTLIDLTTAGTYASVNQIRGRSIRLDPSDPHKVANNWDVVAYEPDLEEGDRDLRRLIGKHIHTWDRVQAAGSCAASPTSTSASRCWGCPCR